MARHQTNPNKPQYAPVFIDNKKYNRICPGICQERWLDTTDVSPWVSIGRCPVCQIKKREFDLKSVKEKAFIKSRLGKGADL